MRRLRLIDGILIFGISYLTSSAVTVILSDSLPVRENTAISVLALLGVAFLLLKLVAGKPLQFVRLTRVRPRFILYAVLASLAIMLPAISLESLVVFHFEVPEELIEALNDIVRARSIPELLYVLLIAAAGAALSEELVFRGILQNCLAARLRASVAVLTTSLVFGLLHAIWRFPPAFVLGLFLGLLYWRTGSLIPPMIAHFTINSVAIATVFAVERYGEASMPSWIREEQPAPLWMVLISLIVLFTVFGLLWKDSRDSVRGLRPSIGEEDLSRIDVS